MKAIMPIARAAMMIRIVCKSGPEFEEIRSKLNSELKVLVPLLELDAFEMKEQIHFDLTIEPDKYKRIEVLIQEITNGMDAFRK